MYRYFFSYMLFFLFIHIVITFRSCRIYDYSFLYERLSNVKAYNVMLITLQRYIVFAIFARGKCFFATIHYNIFPPASISPHITLFILLDDNNRQYNLSPISSEKEKNIRQKLCITNNICTFATNLEQ